MIYSCPAANVSLLLFNFKAQDEKLKTESYYINPFYVINIDLINFLSNSFVGQYRYFSSFLFVAKNLTYILYNC